MGGSVIMGGSLMVYCLGREIALFQREFVAEIRPGRGCTRPPGMPELNLPAPPTAELPAGQHPHSLILGLLKGYQGRRICLSAERWCVRERERRLFG